MKLLIFLTALTSQIDACSYVAGKIVLRIFTFIKISSSP